MIFRKIAECSTAQISLVNDNFEKAWLFIPIFNCLLSPLKREHISYVVSLQHNTDYVQKQKINLKWESDN